MNLKRIFLIALGLWISILLIFGWVKYNGGGPVPYPINTGDFYTVGSAFIDPATLLEDVRNGKELTLRNSKPSFSDDMPFIMSIEWPQEDYLAIAAALHNEIWKDSPSGWQLYRASFFTSCRNHRGGFQNADLYYYQDVKRNGKRMYSVRNILVQPEYGYVAWGGETFFPRPLLGWQKINLEKINSVTAENALALADQQVGSEFRDTENNDCRISVDLWPWGYDRSDWRISYSAEDHSVIWVSMK